MFVSTSFSQTDDEKPKESGPRKQLAIIIFAGLGGAILGLSTLSFRVRPQDNLSSIAVGFALGVISGTIYVTYKKATVPRQFSDLYGDPLEKYLLAKKPYLNKKPVWHFGHRWTF